MLSYGWGRFAGMVVQNCAQVWLFYTTMVGRTYYLLINPTSFARFIRALTTYFSTSIIQSSYLLNGVFGTVSTSPTKTTTSYINFVSSLS